MIANEYVIRDFLDVVFSDAEEEDQAVFVSLSTRAKYLSDEQRLVYSLSHSEMFHRQWFPVNKARDLVIRYLEQIRIQDYLLVDHTDKKGHTLPLNATSVYLNINPSSYRRAVFDLQREILTMMEDNSGYRKIQSKLNTAMQRARGQRLWTDIDVDAAYAPEEIVHFVQKRLPNPLVLQTHSGYHVMVENALMKQYKTNLGEVVKSMQELFNDSSEIKINSNAMVPLPGTFQGGVEVLWL